MVGSSTYKIGECNAEERILCKESMTSYPCTRPPCFHWRPVDKATRQSSSCVTVTVDSRFDGISSSFPCNHGLV